MGIPKSYNSGYTFYGEPQVSPENKGEGLSFTEKGGWEGLFKAKNLLQEAGSWKWGEGEVKTVSDEGKLRGFEGSRPGLKRQ